MDGETKTDSNYLLKYILLQYLEHKLKYQINVFAKVTYLNY